MRPAGRSPPVGEERLLCLSAEVLSADSFSGTANLDAGPG
jgi:hypothetical protein